MAQGVDGANGDARGGDRAPLDNQRAILVLFDRRNRIPGRARGTSTGGLDALGGGGAQRFLARLLRCGKWLRSIRQWGLCGGSSVRLRLRGGRLRRLRLARCKRS